MSARCTNCGQPRLMPLPEPFVPPVVPLVSMPFGLYGREHVRVVDGYWREVRCDGTPLPKRSAALPLPKLPTPAEVRDHTTAAVAAMGTKG